MDAIKKLIWKYQSNFQQKANKEADNIFSLLDNTLKPKVFLVGINISNEEHNKNNSEESLDVIFEPEDCGYIDNQFFNLKKSCDKGFSFINEYFISQYQITQENIEVVNDLNKLKDNIEIIIKENAITEDIFSFSSVPVFMEGYLVFTILQIDKNSFKSYYSLKKEYKNSLFPVAKSLIHATSLRFLRGCVRALERKNPGYRGVIIDRDPEELILSAGKLLMYTPGRAGKKSAGTSSLFHICNTISSLKYESKEGTGSLLIARENHPNIDLLMEFEEPIFLDNFRATRKLLELASDDICLLSDSYKIYGIGRIFGKYDHANEDLFEVQFSKNYTWDLIHYNENLMHVEYGKPSLKQKDISKMKFVDNLKRIFTQIKRKNIENFWKLANEASKQIHGTILIISENAKKEAKRLDKQSTLIKPVYLTPELIQKVSAIDGAILVDEECYCYAIGSILDGKASKKGSSSRGARYNSSVRYVESSKCPCMGIVVSEDGFIDIIPELNPLVYKTDLLRSINKLKRLSKTKSIDEKKFFSLMDFLEEHEFYLNKKMCDDINNAKDLVKESLPSFQIDYKDFKPDKEMDESFFIEEKKD